MNLIAQINSAEKEILLAASSLSYLQHLSELGLLNALERADTHGIKILVLCPGLKELDKNSDNQTQIEMLEEIQKHASVKDSTGQIKGTILIVDGTKVLSISEEGIDALAIYSVNQSLVNNFASLFEALWLENELRDDLLHSKRELLKSNEQLKVHAKLQSEFVNIAAHELRTPITPILVALHLAEQAGDKSADIISLTREQYEMLVRNAKRLQSLANDILQVARIESQKMELYKEKIDLKQEIANVVADIRTLIPDNKRIDITFEPSNESFVVNADRFKLFEVISNLLRNAIKFIQNEGNITIQLEKSNDCKSAIMKITDNGAGIDPEILPRLFQKFAASPTSGGTGLGLYISKSIVEAHGGKIWAENNPSGNGATFTVELPSL